MLRILCISGLCLASALSAPAHAEWQVSAGLAARHLDVKEIGRNGQTLVNERGWLPGVRVRADYALPQWRLGVSADFYRNDISYDGRLQSGAPFRTDTGTTMARLGIDAAYRLTETTHLVVGLERDEWRRRIRGQGNVLGLDERYSSWRLLGGAEFGLAHGTAGNLRARTLLVAAGPERLRVRFDQQVYDDARFTTKAAAGARLGLDFVPAALPAMTIGMEFDWLKVRRSDPAELRRGGVPMGTVAQPEHVRRAITFTVDYRF